MTGIFNIPKANTTPSLKPLPLLPVEEWPTSELERRYHVMKPTNPESGALYMKLEPNGAVLMMFDGEVWRKVIAT